MSGYQHPAASMSKQQEKGVIDGTECSSLVTNQKAMLTQALLHSIQCTIQFLLGPVIRGLLSAETRLVHAIIDLQSQSDTVR